MVRYDRTTNRLLNVYLIDLGASIVRQELLEEVESTVYQFTEIYGAPELVQEARSEKKSDVWSLACLLFFLATQGEKPWRSSPQNSKLAMSKQESFLATLSEKTALAIQWVRPLLEKALCYDLSERIGLVEFIFEL